LTLHFFTKGEMSFHPSSWINYF